MTPQAPKPSMHEVVVGSFEPNTYDTNTLKVGNNFGTTINIINGSEECHGETTEHGNADPRAENRKKYYKAFLKHFNIEKTTEKETSMECHKMEEFNASSAAKVYQYFDKDWSNTNKCKSVDYATEYSVYTPDDYKRCVCDSWGAGKTDCGFEFSANDWK